MRYEFQADLVVDAQLEYIAKKLGGKRAFFNELGLGDHLAEVP